MLKIKDGYFNEVCSTVFICEILSFQQTVRYDMNQSQLSLIIILKNEAMKNNMDELKATIRGQNVEIANLRASLNKR